MFKKIVIAGLSFTQFDAVLAEDTKNQEPSQNAIELMGQLGVVEKNICQSFLDINELEEKTAEQIVDQTLYLKLLNKLTQDPVEYCHEKVLLSVVRWDDGDEPNLR